jgi:site-specific DNA-methyltransferase (adenine-specific)
MNKISRSRSLLFECRKIIATELGKSGVVILPPLDISISTRLLKLIGIHAEACVLDPWYNKGVGENRPDCDRYILTLVHDIAPLTNHLFLWGFPEIVAGFVSRLPKEIELRCWLTWYYKNSPSRVRGWRSAQMTCLHLALPGAVMHVENFLNDVQKDKLAAGKLQYIPGPPSVIEEPLLCGFVGRDEQTGHPSQKPVAVIEKLILMATTRGELILDLMSGSGTTGEAAVSNERFAILCDISEEYTRLAEERLGVNRLALAEDLLKTLDSIESPLDTQALGLPERPVRTPARNGRSRQGQLTFQMK